MKLLIPLWLREQHAIDHLHSTRVKMFPLVFTLVVVLTDVGQSHLHQTLTCHHEASQRAQYKVWCKKSSDNCCKGFSFTSTSQDLENGALQVKQSNESFTITARQLPLGEGVYWCGLLHPDSTITKLAEAHFYEYSTMNHVWSIIRWVLMPCLPLSIIFAHFYTSRKTHKQEESQYAVISTEVIENHRRGAEERMH
ncbi:hypothetical protein GJAV_G00184800 [Gymnothorax javanicus]|nr:hypothetical protein GJAV_G00184800 [Gymnothorax javanicus]